MLQFRSLTCFSKSMEVQCRKFPAVSSHGSPHSCLSNVYTIHSHPLCTWVQSLSHPAQFFSPCSYKRCKGNCKTIKHLRNIEFLPDLLKLQFFRLNTSSNFDKSSQLKWCLWSIEVPHFLHIRLLLNEANLHWSLLSMDFFFYWVWAIAVYRPNVLVT